MRDLSVIIPAAAPGPRMRRWGPRSLVDLPGGHTVLSRQVAIVRAVRPRAEVIVVAGLGSERIFRALPAGVRAVENELYAETGVVRSIGMGLRAAGGSSALVLYGDLVFNEAAVRGVLGAASAILLGPMGDGDVGVTAPRGQATRLDYGLDPKWAQVAYLRGRELELFRAFAWGAGARTSLGHEALNAVLDGGGRLRAVAPEGSAVVDVDRAEDLARAVEIARCAS